MSNVVPLWRWADLQRMWNERQLKGLPVEDLIPEMLREISPERRAPQQVRIDGPVAIGRSPPAA